LPITPKNERKLEFVVAILLAAAVIAMVLGAWWLAGAGLILAVLIPGLMSLNKREEGSGREVRAGLRERFGLWCYILLPLMVVGMILIVLGAGVWFVITMFIAFYAGLRGRTYPPRTPNG
jgi:hypothetical protein